MKRIKLIDVRLKNKKNRKQAADDLGISEIYLRKNRNRFI